MAWLFWRYLFSLSYYDQSFFWALSPQQLIVLKMDLSRKEKALAFKNHVLHQTPLPTDVYPLLDIDEITIIEQTIHLPRGYTGKPTWMDVRTKNQKKRRFSFYVCLDYQSEANRALAYLASQHVPIKKIDVQGKRLPAA